MGQQPLRSLLEKCLERVRSQRGRLERMRGKVAVELRIADSCAARDALKVVRGRSAADDPVRVRGQRGLVDDGVVARGRDAVLLAPCLGKDVMDIGGLVEVVRDRRLRWLALCPLRVSSSAGRRRADRVWRCRAASRTLAAIACKTTAKVRSRTRNRTATAA